MTVLPKKKHEHAPKNKNATFESKTINYEARRKIWEIQINPNSKFLVGLEPKVTKLNGLLICFSRKTIRLNI